jgi:hypothetical protein
MVLAVQQATVHPGRVRCSGVESAGHWPALSAAGRVASRRASRLSRTTSCTFVMAASRVDPKHGRRAHASQSLPQCAYPATVPMRWSTKS